MSLADKLRGAKMPRTGPLWKGPEVDGITQSLLSRFLVCRERFRIHVVEGLRPADKWNHRIGYGEMWHVCEEALAKGWKADANLQILTEYAADQCKRYPYQQEEIAKWYEVCKVQFPIYVDYWSRHPEVVNRTPLLAEQVFDVPYKLPSGRTVRMRGKWDSVDIVQQTCGMCNGSKGVASAHSNKFHPCATCNGKGVTSGIWLQENKTKGDVDERQLQRQLTFDLQTMFYLVALYAATLSVYGDNLDKAWNNTPKLGVRYNVIRRPLSGGKGTIVQKKGSKNVPAETKEAYYTRLSNYIRKEPDTYFFRWNVRVTSADVKKFRRECLDPVLEQLCDWWNYISYCKEFSLRPGEDLDGERYNIHFRLPYGCYNPLLEGNVGDLDNYLDTGDQRGLQQVDELFPELKGVE